MEAVTQILLSELPHHPEKSSKFVSLYFTFISDFVFHFSYELKIGREYESWKNTPINQINSDIKVDVRAPVFTLNHSNSFVDP